MVQKYFLIAVFLMSICIVSCRQDDELQSEKPESVEFSLKQALPGDENPYFGKSDSASSGDITPTDPPKNGTHWRIRQDSIIVGAPDNP